MTGEISVAGSLPCRVTLAIGRSFSGTGRLPRHARFQPKDVNEFTARFLRRS
jgi:hypothetical protein